MGLGKEYRQLKFDYEMARALYDRWDTGNLVEYIKQDYAEASINVLEALLEEHPDLWEMVDSLE